MEVVMRDNLCEVNDLQETIEFNDDDIKEFKEKIAILHEDTKNGVQRFPYDNDTVIQNTYCSIFKYSMLNIRAKYSLGADPETIEQDYVNAIDALTNLNDQEVGYVNLLWMVSLGILLETDSDNIKCLADKAERENIQDDLLDFLFGAYDIDLDSHMSHYEKSNPYKCTRQIIDSAFMQELDKAKERLQVYVKEEWFKGHSDYEWKNAFKKPGYVGFWSFESAAIAKLFALDDTALREDIHYPYELAHYKAHRQFRLSPITNWQESVAEDGCGYDSISVNVELDQLIPAPLRNYVSEIIKDFETLPKEEFYDNYELSQIWYVKEEFVSECEESSMLGSLLVFLLASKEFIMQLDYKEDLEDNLQNMTNMWKNEKVKIARFLVDNDQYYYAYVPEMCSLSCIYEVSIEYESYQL